MKPRIIRSSGISEDAWQLLGITEAQSPESVPLPSGQVIFPLSVWQVRCQEIAARRLPYGIFLMATDAPEVLADALVTNADQTHPDFGLITLIAVNFAVFTDGRGYSIARLVRERYGFKGELRAVGDVQVDQIYYMSRVGFDAFALPVDKNPERALAAFNTFSDAYQSGVDEPLPLFRRRVGA